MDPVELRIIKEEIFEELEDFVVEEEEEDPLTQQDHHLNNIKREEEEEEELEHVNNKPLEIGSKNSAFQPYKPLTILTNLQRGNVKTLSRDTAPTHPLTFQEQAAKGTLTEDEINESNVNSLDSDGLSPLMWASFHGKLPTVQLLITKGADVSTPSTDGQTALMFACGKGHLDVVRHLLFSGADLEGEDEYGNTPLIHATNNNQSHIVSQLLTQGAELTKANYIGDNAFEIAFKKGFKTTQYVMECHLKKVLETLCE